MTTAANVAPVSADVLGPAECPFGELSATFGERWEEPLRQYHVPLVLANESPEPCGLSGFPEVEFVGPHLSSFGGIFQLRRQKVDARPVDISDGSTAHAVITWLPGNKESEQDPWTPQYVRVVLPGSDMPFLLAWPYGSVLRQDMATRPGTYVGPIVEGSP